MVIELQSVIFQNQLSGDPKQVMTEMARHFIDTRATEVPIQDLPKRLCHHLEDVYDLIVRRTVEGSLRITVECRTLEILEHLWGNYRSGNLNAVAEECLLTDDIKRGFHVESVKLKTTILEEDYLACKLFLKGILHELPRPFV